MNTKPLHESPELIATELESCLTVLRKIGIGGDEQIQAHALKLMKGVCRAAAHGRMPDHLRAQYHGMLRNLRPHVLRLQRNGKRVPAIVISETMLAWKK
jgi:hypothetical protein